jgi:hypothetical protein
VLERGAPSDTKGRGSCKEGKSLRTKRGILFFKIKAFDQVEITLWLIDYAVEPGKQLKQTTIVHMSGYDNL